MNCNGAAPRSASVATRRGPLDDIQDVTSSDVDWLVASDCLAKLKKVTLALNDVAHNIPSVRELQMCHVESSPFILIRLRQQARFKEGIELHPALPSVG